MASDPNIGTVDDLRIVENDSESYWIDFTAVGNGSESVPGAAGVTVRYSHDGEPRWWLMQDLGAWDLAVVRVGAVLRVRLDMRALFLDRSTEPATLLPMPEPGDETLFKVSTYRLEPDGSKTWGHKWPGDDNGAGPAHVHVWGTEDAIPEPAPVEPVEPAPVGLDSPPGPKYDAINAAQGDFELANPGHDPIAVMLAFNTLRVLDSSLARANDPATPEDETSYVWSLGSFKVVPVGDDRTFTLASVQQITSAGTRRSYSLTMVPEALGE